MIISPSDSDISVFLLFMLPFQEGISYPVKEIICRYCLFWMFVFSVCTTYANYCSKTFRSKASSEGIGKHLRLYIPSFRSFTAYIYYSKTSHEGTGKHFRLHIPFFLRFTAHISTQKLLTRVQASVSGFIYPPSAISQLILQESSLAPRSSIS